MKRTLWIAACAVAASLSGAHAQDSGKNEYMIACAGCHGESGKGDGPIAGLLEIHTPDLTRLTERAGGSFPFRNTLLLIDGRNEVRAHGSEMPVWGDRYVSSVSAPDNPAVSSPEAAELMARGRLLALVSYLETIQE